MLGTLPVYIGYLYTEKKFVVSDYCTKYKPASKRQVRKGKPICGEWRKKTDLQADNGE